jgi:transposase
MPLLPSRCFWLNRTSINGQAEATDRAKLIAAAKHLSQKGHTQREIAEILNIGKGTVGRYLSEINDGQE